MDSLEELKRHRRVLERNLQKSFGVDDELDIEKARMVGDITIWEGKAYVWTEYAPGKFDWHVFSPKNVVVGKGVNGKHGMACLNSIYTSIDKNYTDKNKMMLKRTPNGNWRLHYDNQDTGQSIYGDVITSSELEKDGVCYQSNMVVDNFDMVKDYMEFNSPDDVYFIQIIKRWKDNKDKPNADAWKAGARADGSYHAGAQYLQHYLVHSYDELQALKNHIVKLCQYNNARAYMSINTRSQSQTEAYLPKFTQGKNPNDPRVKNAEAILYGMPKSGAAWKNERFKVLLDIDATRDTQAKMTNGKTVNVWDETERRLKAANIKVACKYETPSGGLHLILNNKNNRNIRDFYNGLKDFDGGKNLGTAATVHPSEDVKMVLYSNVETAGY
jgi:hypothetical protein